MPFIREITDLDELKKAESLLSSSSGEGNGTPYRGTLSGHDLARYDESTTGENPWPLNDPKKNKRAMTEQEERITSGPVTRRRLTPHEMAGQPFGVWGDQKPAIEGTPQFLIRHGGGNKGKGYLGKVPSLGPHPDAAESEVGGGASFATYPSMVPTLTPDELVKTVNFGNGEPIPESVYEKAEAHAFKRLREGKTAFATKEEEGKNAPHPGLIMMQSSRHKKESSIPETLYGFPIRQSLFKGEEEYFKKNPHVGGMAAEDGSIILNPHSPLSDQEKQAVVINEASRLFLKDNPDKYDIDVTPSQKKAFKGTDYGKPENLKYLKETILGRILSGDPSVGTTTLQQKAVAKRLLRDMESRNM